MKDYHFTYICTLWAAIYSDSELTELSIRKLPMWKAQGKRQFRE